MKKRVLHIAAASILPAASIISCQKPIDNVDGPGSGDKPSAPSEPVVEEPEDQDRPNIVVIVADDLLSSELSCNGGENIYTPNIDRLAVEGMQFRRIYASEAISVPIRASMYTGLYPARHGSYCNHKDTNLGTKTVNEYLPEEGYRVGRTGKNHPVTKDVYFFDEIPGFTVLCTATSSKQDPSGIKEWMQKDDNPFLLFVCSIHPHAPWTCGNPAEFDKSKFKMPENCIDSPAMRDIFANYLAEVRVLDNQVGIVMKTLEEIGKLDNTIVMFLGEQGPQFPGGKWTLWNPGVHSTLLVRYPKKVKPGSRTDAMVQYEDLLPTFLDIAGGKPRPELDGISFKDVMYGKKNEARKYVYGIHNNKPEGTAYPIRSIRDDKYALIVNLKYEVEYYEKHLVGGQGPTAVWPTWQAAEENGDEKAAFLIDRFLHRPEIEFYDIENDPWEFNNLANDPAYAGRISIMMAELHKWMEQQGDKGIKMDVGFTNRKGNGSADADDD